MLLARCFFLPPPTSPPSISLPLSWAPLWSQRGAGRLGRREKLFQKCPVTPAEEGALFSLSDDAGEAAFLLPVIYICIIKERLSYISLYGLTPPSE